MPSIIQELQKDALDRNISVSDLLRKAKLIATKLELTDFLAWINKELNGYGDKEKVPEYRIIRGEVKGWNPYHGWQPVIFQDSKIHDWLSQRGASQPISELEDIVSQKDYKGILIMPFSPEVEKMIIESVGMATNFALIVQKTSSVGILDRVRNILLEWSLKLEKEGILGEALSFSEIDKEKAQKTIYNIGNIHNFTGNIGPLSDNAVISIQQLNAGDIEDIKNLLGQIKKYTPDLQLNKDSQKKLEDITKELNTEILSPKPEEGKIKKLLNSLKNIFEGVAGNVIAQGILSVISKYLT